MRAALALASLFAPAGWGATMLATEVHGEAIEEAARTQLTAVTTMAPKSRLYIGQGARVVIAYVEDAREFELRGPGHYRLDALAPQPLDQSTVPAVRSLPAAYRDIKLDAAKVKQLGVVMRSGDTGSLSPRGVLLEAPAALTWQTPTMRAPYTVTLADYAGTLILREKTDVPSLALPRDSVKEGVRYRWSVEATGMDGQLHIRATTFAVPEAHLRARLAELRADAGETPARRALYEAVLFSLNVSATGAPLVAQKRH